jgi:tetratricopeptide (TPR) repeat protein
MGKAYYYKNDFAKSYKLLNHAAKKFKDQESRFDARFWLARLYAREGNSEKAMKYLSHLEADEELPDRLKMDIAKLYTSIYLENDNMDNAITELRSAISHAKKKSERLRLTYLLGQLYKNMEERRESMNTFSRVLKMHPEYRMEFYTRIQMAMAYSVETGGADGVRKELMKMLRDEKYTEFRDQIYYALAEMSYSEKDVPQTIDYLTKSTLASDGNDNQKAKSYWRLGQIYFMKPNYPLAQAAYDSCVTYMPNDFPDAENIRNLSNNLKDLVAQILIIETQDSLQMVARMSPSEREDLITDLIQKRISEEEKKQLEEELAADNLANPNSPSGLSSGGPGGPGGFGGPGAGSNKWYFYNPTTRNAGATEFTRLWGKRANADDWRRSSKEQSFNEDEITANEEEFYVDENGDTLKITGDWLDPNYYLKDLPVTDAAIEASNLKIVNAYYALSIIYKDQMDDVPMAISTLEEMNNRFNPNEHIIDSYYRLYRMYLDEDNISKSDYYKNKILNEYPDSQYAKVIQDPNFLEKENADYETASLLYQKAYIKYYKRGYYQQTVEECERLIKNYQHTEILPKAKFLHALSIGHTQGEEALRKELEAIAKEYKGNEYGLKAEELLAGLNIKVEEARKKAADEANAQQKAKLAEKMDYKYEPNSKHNFVIIIKASGKKLSDIKREISDYNRKNYKMEGLKMSAVVYKKGMQMITVKSFSNAKQAMQYKKSFMNSSSLGQIVANNPNYFIVSFTNYALFYKPKDHINYQVWADVKYKELK